MGAISTEKVQPERFGAATQPLGRHTAFGFLWMFLQTIVTKGAGMAGQIAVAWFLSPHDFKLVGLTFSLVSFPNLLRDAGLQTILIQRQKHFRRWVGPAFWMSLVLGVGAAIIIAGGAPIFARAFDQPELTGLLNILAISTILNALGTVPSSIVQIHLRFRFQAMLSLALSLVLQVLSVLLAWRHFGPYSYIVPNMVCAAIQTATLWLAEPTQIRLKWHIRRWKYLVGDGGTVVLISLCWMVVTMGDYLSLGVFHKHDDALGIFYFAFNLSWQTIVVLTTNIGSVLYPALMKLQHDLTRQMQAYLRAMRVLALLTVPACFMQAAMARPGFELVFKPKWAPAIPVMQVLCLGMAIRCVGLTVGAVNMARRRYRLQLLLSFIYCVLFLATMAVAARLGAALAVAAAEAGFYIVVDPINMAVILYLNGERPLRELARIFAKPLIAAVIAVGAAWAISQTVPPFRGALVARLAIIGLVSVGIYLPLSRKIMPGTWNELAAFRRSKAAPQASSL